MPTTYRQVIARASGASGLLLDAAMVRRILPAKAKARNTRWDSADDFRDPRLQRLYRDQWVGRLQGFVGQLPSFDDAWDVYSKLLDDVVAIPMDTATPE